MDEISTVIQLAPSIETELAPPSTIETTLSIGQGPAGPPGATSGDKNTAWTQSSAASVWTIAHNLGKYPSVTVKDSGGDIVEGGIEYPNANTVILSFTSSFSGTAYLN